MPSEYAPDGHEATQYAVQRLGSVFLTLGEGGLNLFRHDGEPYALEPTSRVSVSGPIDIVGAGDSCSAGIVSAMVSGLTHEQAAAFGNLVASITIQQIGVTGTATPEQVRRGGGR